MKWTQATIEAKLAQHRAWRDTPSPTFLVDIPGTEAEQVEYTKKMKAWTESNGTPCHLVNDDLSGLDFSDMDLRMVIFECCNLSGAVFRGADTRGARICSHRVTWAATGAEDAAAVKDDPRIRLDLRRWPAVSADIRNRIHAGDTTPVTAAHLRALGLYDAVLAAVKTLPIEEAPT
jgi:hypothetical protein